jgi:hypothetical protein
VTRLMTIAAATALLLAACGGAPAGPGEQLDERPDEQLDEQLDENDLPDAGGPDDEPPAAAAEGEPRQAILRYSLSGDATVSGEEVAVHVCSINASEDSFRIESIGDLAFSIDADGGQPGQHAADFEVLPPPEFRGDPGEPSRATGLGTLSFEDDGTDAVLGMEWVSGSFAGHDLSSPQGHTFSIEGSFTCPPVGSG